MSAAVALAAFCGAEIIIACLPGLSARVASDRLMDMAQRGIIVPADFEVVDGSPASFVANPPSRSRDVCKLIFHIGGEDRVGPDFRGMTSVELASDGNLLLNSGVGQKARVRLIFSSDASPGDRRDALDAIRLLQRSCFGEPLSGGTRQ